MFSCQKILCFSMGKIPFLISNMELKQNIIHEACQDDLHKNHKVII